MFKKILIANRGEIACRIMRTARRMGIATVAVYSDTDAGTPHVMMADEAVHIGGAASADSYLRGERIIAAAKETGAEAIHPGFGFLSENAGFVAEVEAAGPVTIGYAAPSLVGGQIDIQDGLVRQAEAKGWQLITTNANSDAQRGFRPARHPTAPWRHCPGGGPEHWQRDCRRDGSRHGRRGDSRCRGADRRLPGRSEYDRLQSAA